MALVPSALELLATVLRGVVADCPSRRIASLGYPDILASPAQLGRLFGEDFVAQVEYRADSSSIVRWHGAGHLTEQVPEARHFFKLLGYELDVIDVIPVRGGEIIQDLNQPVPVSLHERYAVVIDAGTLEHCFNIATAARNVAEMVAAGGAAVHGNPLNMYNHGFYNFSPTWYFDFYETNGFKVELLNALHDPLGSSRLAQLPAHGRFDGVPDNCTLLVVARRMDIRPISWPIQRKYRVNPDLKG